MPATRTSTLDKGQNVVLWRDGKSIPDLKHWLLAGKALQGNNKGGNDSGATQLNRDKAEKEEGK